MMSVRELGSCRVAPAAVAAVAFLFASCAAPKSARVEGVASFQFVGDPAPPNQDAKPAQETGDLPQVADVLVPAEPIGPLASPVYPSAALGKTRYPTLVGVQIFVDESGRVTRIGPSLRAISTPVAAAGDFLTAVEAAVMQWRFVPAERRRMKRVRGSLGAEDFWLVTQSQKTEYALDVTFTFSTKGDVVMANGAVER
jgi:hypothetical protein